jgi:hypothetical protein
MFSEETVCKRLAAALAVENVVPLDNVRAVDGSREPVAAPRESFPVETVVAPE